MNPAASAATPASPNPQCARSSRRSEGHRAAAAPSAAHAWAPSGLSRRLMRVIGTRGPSASPSAAPPRSPIRFDPRSSQRSRHVGRRGSAAVPSAERKSTEPRRARSSTSCAPSSSSTANISSASANASPWPSSPRDFLSRAYASARSKRSRRSAARRMASASRAAPGHRTLALRMASLANGNPRPRVSHASATPSAAAQASLSPHETSSENTRGPRFSPAAPAATAASTRAAAASAEWILRRLITVAPPGASSAARSSSAEPGTSTPSLSFTRAALTPTSHSKRASDGHAARNNSQSPHENLPVSPRCATRKSRNRGLSRTSSSSSPRLMPRLPVTSRRTKLPQATFRSVASAAGVAAPRASTSRHAASARCPSPPKLPSNRASPEEAPR